jgi:hypothetical protein
MRPLGLQRLTLYLSTLIPSTRATCQSLRGFFIEPQHREAVREKNERVLKERMVFLSEALAAQSLAENQAMDTATGDGLA